MPPPYKNPVCRGSFYLGSACGHCERCADERERMKKQIEEGPEEPHVIGYASGGTEARKTCPTCAGVGTVPVSQQPISETN